MINAIQPTEQQAALYGRLLRTYGQSPQWQTLTRARHFERMTPHRAAHFIARLLDVLTGHAASVPCGCTGSVYAAANPKHPDGRPGVPVRRSV